MTFYVSKKSPNVLSQFRNRTKAVFIFILLLFSVLVAQQYTVSAYDHLNPGV